jgi:hypothetical protein
MVGTNFRLQNSYPAGLLGTGLISLALYPTPVEEQPVARTTVAPSATASNAARSMCFPKAPKQSSGSKVPLLEGRTLLTEY